jgi:hypothetical protein
MRAPHARRNKIRVYGVDPISVHANLRHLGKKVVGRSHPTDSIGTIGVPSVFLRPPANFLFLPQVFFPNHLATKERRVATKG